MNKDQIVKDILTKPKELSPEQASAVITNSRFTRIIAGAGAGKTETLTRRIVYLLICENVSPSSIVAFTFTEKAAQSMKSRLYQRISQMGREDIVKKLGEMYIGTIHGFCLRILEDHFGYGNHNVFDENQEMAYLQRFGWELGLNKGGPYSKNCEDFLNTLNVVYNEMVDRELLKKRAPDFYNMLIKYEEYLDSHHILTFNRMGYEAISRLKENPEKTSYIRYLIVDEFQDINSAQFLLISLIGSNASVFVVGDPRQSIYQWRGSNERFFLDFLSHFTGAKSIEIKENRRSVKEIVSVSNKFADCFKQANYEHLAATREDKGEVTKLVFDRPEDEALWISRQIERLVNENHCKYSDFGILVRSVNTSAEPFIRIFKERKIPYLVGGKIGLFKRDEAQAVGRLMSWLSDEGFWVENIYNWKDKVTGDDLLESGIQFWESAVDFSISNNVRDDLKKWKKDVLDKKYKDFKSVYHALLHILDYNNFNLDNGLHAACMANLGRFSSLIGDYQIAMRLGGRAPDWKREFKSLCWFMNSYAAKSYEEQTVDDIRQVNAVQIMTVHQAKGLEWPVVFLPALVKPRFPTLKSGRERTWLIPRDLFDVMRYEGGIEEEKRLFYVAITRARDISILSYFKKQNKTSKSQSEFLDIMDQMSINESNGDLYSLNYKSPEKIEDEDIQTFTALEIIQYMKCPHHYRLNNLWGYIQAFSPLIGYGEALHFCLRYASELIKKGYSPVSAVATAVDEKFFVPFAGKDLSDKIRASAKKYLVQFAIKHEKDMNNIEEVETRLEFPLQNATIVGKVDVIMKENDTFEIRDYKTSDQVISDEDSFLQVRLYSLGLQELGRNIDRGSIAYLENASIKSVSIETNELNNSKKTATEVISNIRSGCFNPKPSEFCGKCEYSGICKWRK